MIPIVLDHSPDLGRRDAIVPGPGPFLLILDHHPGDAEADGEKAQAATAVGVGEVPVIAATVVMMIGAEAEVVDGVDEADVRRPGSDLQRWSLGQGKRKCHVKIPIDLSLLFALQPRSGSGLEIEGIIGASDRMSTRL